MPLEDRYVCRLAEDLKTPELIVDESFERPNIEGADSYFPPRYKFREDRKERRLGLA